MVSPVLAIPPMTCEYRGFISLKLFFRESLWVVAVLFWGWVCFFPYIASYYRELLF